MAIELQDRDKGPLSIDIRQRPDWFLTALLCLPLVGLRLYLLVIPLPMRDFMTYWSAGRLFVSGGSPYSMAATFAMSRSLGWAYGNQFVMLNPPWALLLFGPLSYLPFQVAHYVNFGLDVLLEVASSLALWLYFGGNKAYRWIAIAVLGTFLPAGLAEHYGQITPVIFAGLTGLLFCLRSGRNVLAGACLVILGLKAHLLYLVLLAILLWSWRQRKLSVPITAIVLAAVSSAICVVINPAVLDYFHGTVHAALDTNCGVGGLLRYVFGVRHEWLQFLPCLFGLGWFLRHWHLHRDHWVWEERLPMLLLISLGSSPYFWVHDFVLAIPSLIALSIQVWRSNLWHLAMPAYLLVQVVILASGRGACGACLLWIPFYWALQSRARTCQQEAELVGCEPAV